MILLMNCERPLSWENVSDGERYMVVDGILTDEYGFHSIRLYWSVSKPAEEPEPVSGAYVLVEKSDGIIWFPENDSIPGLYVSQIPFKPYSAEAVHLYIRYENREYFATDKLLPVSASPRIQFFNVQNDSLLMQVMPVTLASIEPAMWEIRIEWDTSVIFYGKGLARLWVYDLKVINSAQIFAPAQEKVYVPRGAKVYQTKYSLSDQHVQFRSSLLQETHWRGGAFDVSPGMVYTNIRGPRAAGYFGCCAVVRDTFFVQ